MNNKNIKKRISVWVSSHYINLALFNLMIVILVLLHSAKYFDPYWMISINVIVFYSFISSIFLFGVGSRIMFFFALTFWLFAGLIKIMGVNVWADRVTIYVYEALLLGMVLLTFEIFGITNRNRIMKSSGML